MSEINNSISNIQGFISSRSSDIGRLRGQLGSIEGKIADIKRTLSRIKGQKGSEGTFNQLSERLSSLRGQGSAISNRISQMEQDIRNQRARVGQLKKQQQTQSSNKTKQTGSKPTKPQVQSARDKVNLGQKKVTYDYNGKLEKLKTMDPNSPEYKRLHAELSGYERKHGLSPCNGSKPQGRKLPKTPEDLKRAKIDSLIKSGQRDDAKRLAEQSGIPLTKQEALALRNDGEYLKNSGNGQFTLGNVSKEANADFWRGEEQYYAGQGKGSYGNDVSNFYKGNKVNIGIHLPIAGQTEKLKDKSKYLSPQLIKEKKAKEQAFINANRGKIKEGYHVEEGPNGEYSLISREKWETKNRRQNKINETKENLLGVGEGVYNFGAGVINAVLNPGETIEGLTRVVGDTAQDGKKAVEGVKDFGRKLAKGDRSSFRDGTTLALNLAMLKGGPKGAKKVMGAKGAPEVPPAKSMPSRTFSVKAPQALKGETISSSLNTGKMPVPKAMPSAFYKIPATGGIIVPLQKQATLEKSTGSSTVETSSKTKPTQTKPTQTKPHGTKTPADIIDNSRQILARKDLTIPQKAQAIAKEISESNNARGVKDTTTPEQIEGYIRETIEHNTTMKKKGELRGKDWADHDIEGPTSKFDPDNASQLAKPGRDAGVVRAIKKHNEASHHAKWGDTSATIDELAESASDVYSSWRMKRCYKKAWTHEDCFNQIAKEFGEGKLSKNQLKALEEDFPYQLEYELQEGIITQAQKQAIEASGRYFFRKIMP